MPYIQKRVRSERARDKKRYRQSETRVRDEVGRKNEKNWKETKLDYEQSIR